MALPTVNKAVKLKAYKSNWKINLLILENRTTKNIRNQEYRVISQIQRQIASSIQTQIPITVHLRTNQIYTNGLNIPY